MYVRTHTASAYSLQEQQFLLPFRLSILEPDWSMARPVTHLELKVILKVILEPDWSMARPVTHLDTLQLTILGTRYLILRTPAGNLEH